VPPRPFREFAVSHIPGARNVAAKFAAPNRTAVVIDAREPEQFRAGTLPAARYVAQAIAHEAFHNVAFFAGTFAEANALVRP
jgi:rhodanese-related sulfurtransferase